MPIDSFLARLGLARPASGPLPSPARNRPDDVSGDLADLGAQAEQISSLASSDDTPSIGAELAIPPDLDLGALTPVWKPARLATGTAPVPTLPSPTTPPTTLTPAAPTPTAPTQPASLEAAPEDLHDQAVDAANAVSAFITQIQGQYSREQQLEPGTGDDFRLMQGLLDTLGQYTAIDVTDAAGNLIPNARTLPPGSSLLNILKTIDSFQSRMLPQDASGQPIPPQSSDVASLVQSLGTQLGVVVVPAAPEDAHDQAVDAANAVSDFISQIQAKYSQEQQLEPGTGGDYRLLQGLANTLWQYTDLQIGDSPNTNVLPPGSSLLNVLKTIDAFTARLLPTRQVAAKNADGSTELDDHGNPVIETVPVPGPPSGVDVSAFVQNMAGQLGVTATPAALEDPHDQAVDAANAVSDFISQVQGQYSRKQQLQPGTGEDYRLLQGLANTLWQYTDLQIGDAPNTTTLPAGSSLLDILKTIDAYRARLLPTDASGKPGPPRSSDVASLVQSLGSQLGAAVSPAAPEAPHDQAVDAANAVSDFISQIQAKYNQEQQLEPGTGGDYRLLQGLANTLWQYTDLQIGDSPNTSVLPPGSSLLGILKTIDSFSARLLPTQQQQAVDSNGNPEVDAKGNPVMETVPVPGPPASSDVSAFVQNMAGQLGVPATPAAPEDPHDQAVDAANAVSAFITQVQGQYSREQQLEPGTGDDYLLMQGLANTLWQYTDLQIGDSPNTKVLPPGSSLLNILKTIDREQAKLLRTDASGKPVAPRSSDIASLVQALGTQLGVSVTPAAPEDPHDQAVEAANAISDFISQVQAKYSQEQQLEPGTGDDYRFLQGLANSLWPYTDLQIGDSPNTNTLPAGSSLLKVLQTLDAFAPKLLPTQQQQALDSNGNPEVDAKGNPVMETVPVPGTPASGDVSRFVQTMADQLGV